ncbi:MULTISPECIES: hypothetical protein [unclassified Mesorhizobium]|uniref:hypothetical protein n=1 Tax=unclassified Mesorhizobium TaxID=325217 RepID=UPI00112916AE|nr:MULTISPECIES: hypothetical protein [unclassified Mesorhizobium]TPN47895.1 hypothetical protein FJ976_19830 [Mesorhizobium sp. B1-1-9]TPN52156.1 hypothetical protein FJ978_11600 [Mesorhizobium sp. B1-1-7]
MRSLGRCLASLVFLATPAMAEDFDPASLDLAALIECRADVPAYNGFALWLAGEPGAADRLGWKEVPSGNPFLRQYQLPAPVHVFGRETGTVVFTATGPMAVLDGIVAPDLARQLSIPATVSTPDKFLGEKVVAESTEDTGGVSLATRITLNVSTVESHPGKTLAGCSYALDVK